MTQEPSRPKGEVFMKLDGRSELLFDKRLH